MLVVQSLDERSGNSTSFTKDVSRLPIVSNTPKGGLLTPVKVVLGILKCVLLTSLFFLGWMDLGGCSLTNRFMGFWS